MRNKKSTRYFSDIQEAEIAKKLGGRRTSNSGASKFESCDVVIDEADLVVECKTSMTDKESFSIKKEWIEKQKNESFAMRKSNSALCFRFGPNQEDYFVIGDKLMRFLIDKLSEENN